MAEHSTPSSSSATGGAGTDESEPVATPPGSEPDTIVPVPVDALQGILQRLSELETAERARHDPVRAAGWAAAGSVGAGDGAARAERVADAYDAQLRSPLLGAPPPPPQPLPRSESPRLKLDPQKLQKGGCTSVSIPLLPR